MRKIVIANQKGGVAKTTTAVNLAAGLALKGRRTLLIDMDPQANATFAVLGPEAPKRSVYHMLITEQPLSSFVLATAQPLLDIIPSSIDLAGAEVELISRVGGQTELRAKLSEAEPTLVYDYIIIDAPPSLGYLTINALAAAEEVIIPVSSGVFALNGIAMLENTIKQVRRAFNNPKLHVAGVLCTIYDNTNVARDVVAETQRYFGELVFKSIIPKNIKVEEAHSRGESVFTYANDSKGAEAYRDFVEEVIAHEPKI
jgi:chromosome partitioning protein